MNVWLERRHSKFVIPVLIAATLFLSQPVPAPDPKPSIFIFFTPGGWTPNVGRGEFEIAVWGNGRIVWRTAAPVWARRNGNWGLPEGKYMEGKVEPAKVRAALDHIRDAGAYAQNRQGAVWPDSHYTTMIVLDNGRSLRISASQDPESKPLPSWANAWNLIRHEARLLIPKSGRVIPRPDDRAWAPLGTQ